MTTGLLQLRMEQLMYQISYSNRATVKAAAKEAKARGNDLARNPSQRVTWKALATLLRAEERRF